MLLVNFMRQTVTKSCLRTVKPLHFAKFEKLYPVIFLVKYAKFFIINVGLRILLFIQSQNLHNFAGTIINFVCGLLLIGDSVK